MIARAVREALGSLVSPSICDQLVRRSLRAQGLAAVPECGTEIGDWLEGALRDEVEAVMGPDAADLMMMQLGPIAAYAAFSQPVPPPARRSVQPVIERERGEPQLADGLTARPTSRMEARPKLHEALPAVLVASKNLTALSALRRCLAGSASVSQVLDLVGLFDVLEEQRSTRLLLLLDCLKPTLHSSSLSVLGEGSARRFPVLLWGASDQEWSDAERELTPAFQWVRCASEVKMSDVGALCAMLLR